MTDTVRCNHCGAEGLYYEEGYKWVLMNSGGIPHRCDPAAKAKWKNRGFVPGEMVPEKTIKQYKYVDQEGRTISFERYLELQKIRQEEAAYNEKRCKELKEEAARWACHIRDPIMEKFWADFKVGRYRLKDRSWFGKVIYDGSNIPSPYKDRSDKNDVSTGSN